MLQRERLLQTARSLIGQGESESNNRGGFVKMLHREVRDEGNWCSAFVAWCLEETHVCDLIPDKQRRGAKGLVKYLVRELDGHWIAKPRWLRSAKILDLPTMGDVITWHRGDVRSWKGHVELVERYDSASDTLHTIAGNVGRYPAKVKARIHSAGSWRDGLYGIVRLPVLHTQPVIDVKP